MASSTPKYNLREQKRRKTHAAIELTATQLVAAQGFSQVRIDDICRHVSISKRTFFNYFDSKETAVLGSPLAMPDETALNTFVETSHRNLPKAIITFILDHVLTTDQSIFEPSEIALLVQRRKQIIRDNKLLGLEVYSNYATFQSQLAELLTAYLTQHPTAQLHPHTPISEQARALSLAATSAIRLGYYAWVEPTCTQDLRDCCFDALSLLHLSTQ
ncbi:TetR/AcrR family transcriptional regulator [Corynebacterium sp. HS2168-gen11]|uniref:TetR/AcrR family transcriptional regulator n=1 Tax=Corynebacterium sp. HS2168-gen11 TaxID=2974027 RepID=UPI00216AF243|nr:TetR/AcrR family transcriptional regulator [Corynebacterium sp. HS2168-gen11]MCS4534968.1 TetR/AcrR family transcriptional regulator [Corynebacterium sp. HS2168-gen11]